MPFIRAIACLCILLLGCGAEARTRGAPYASAPTGRVVQNGFGIAALPYSNFMKSWGGSGSVSVNGNNLATSLNADGFPNGTLLNNLGGSLFLPPDAFLGPMRFKWTGTLGGFFLGLNMTATSGGSFLSGSTFSGVNGDVTFNVNALTTSATSNSLAFGAKTFTVGAGLSLVANDKVLIAQTASLVNYALATVTSYSGTTLVVNIDMFYGSGTFSSWNVWALPNEVNSFFSGGVANSGLGNFILCRDQDYATIAAGGDDSYFYHKFLSVIATENPQILRPMGETLNSGSEAATNPIAALDKPLTSMSYAQQKTFPPSAFAGDASGVDTMTTGSYPIMPGSWTDKETFIFNAPANTVTMTIASPARLSLPRSVVPGEVFTLRTSGALPTGVSAGTYYYALDAGTTNIRIAATPGGAAINTSGTQSGVHSMSLTTARVITAVADNGSNIPRVTLLSTTGLSTNDIVQANMGNIGAFKITVINATQIDLASSWPSGAVLNFSAGGQTWATTTGLSPISDPGGSNRSYITTTSINVGARGAKQVTGLNGLPLYPGRLNVAVDPGGSGRVNGNNVCIYDATIDVLMCDNDGLYAYTMPLPAQVALANKLNKHLWYDPGVAVSDAKVTADIQYIATHLNSWLKLFFALSNETWNASFSQNYYLLRYGVAKNYAYSSSGPVQQGYTSTGIRTLQVMDLATAAWTGAGRSAASLRRVISVQAFGSPSLFQTYLLNGNDLPGPNNAFPNRPVDHADVLTYANYWNGVLFNNQFAGTNAEYAPMVNAAADYASGVPAQMASALLWAKNDFLGLNGNARPTGTTDFSVNSQASTGGTNANIYPAWEAVVASYDAVRAGGGMAPVDVVAYEGGQDYVGPTSAQCTALSITAPQCTQIANLLAAFLFDPQAAAMVVAAQQAFINASFSHNKNGSFLQLEGPNEWSLLSGNFFSRPYQLYNGAAQYNQ